MPAVERIGPHQAHARVEAGRALLVCAYDSDAKFQEFHLDGAIPLSALQSRLGSIPRDQEIIFYCA